MGRRGRWAWNAVNIIFIVIGIGGIPSELQQWDSWLRALDQNLARWIFVGAGVLGLLVVNVLRRVNKRSTLQAEALALSGEILRFLGDRQQPLRLPKAGTWRRDNEQMLDHTQQTMALYSERFGARVRAMRDELAGKELMDKDLDQMYEHPTNPGGIRIIGERLGALAHRLPRDGI